VVAEVVDLPAADALLRDTCVHVSDTKAFDGRKAVLEAVQRLARIIRDS